MFRRCGVLVVSYPPCEMPGIIAAPPRTGLEPPQPPHRPHESLPDALGYNEGMGILEDLLDIQARIQEHAPPRCELVVLHPADHRALVLQLEKELPEDYSYIWYPNTEGYPTTYMGVILESDVFVKRGKAKVYERASNYRQEVEVRERWLNRTRN